jgi:hypothetical protein
MSTESSPTTESSQPSDVPPGEVPNTETGAGIGAGEPSTFEPEEDPEAVPDPSE